MRLRYTRPALAELDGILEYIATHSPQGAARVHSRLQSVIDLLPSHPKLGAQTDDPTIRRVSATPFPYLIFYEVAGDTIIVHAIRHGARNPHGMPGAR